MKFRRVVRFASLFVLVLLVLFVIVWFGGRAWLGRSVARYEGTERADVLAPVEIAFDTKGIPQIYAESDRDLFFGLGYVHASERLFQMELIRRVARGELSEVFGEAAFETDVAQRRIGFTRIAKEGAASLAPDSSSLVDAYVAGVNAWISSAKVLPPEFVLLRFEPRRWSREDVIAIGVYQTWFSHELTDGDRAMQSLHDKLGAAALPLLRSPHAWSPPTVGSESPVDPEALRIGTASNSWAVAPSRSASGHAMHASDPHLAIDRAPVLWYIAGLHSREGTNVIGVTAPGLPFVAMGHNGTISWAFTVAAIDLVDYYEERLEGDGVITRGGAVPIGRLDEWIRVKGETEPRRVTVESTPNGVLVERDETRGLAMKWAGADFPAGAVLENGLKLHRASDFGEFRRAVTGLGALNANWVYSDRAGNIGYQLGSPVPLRGEGDAFLAQQGNDPAAEWRGYLPSAETPWTLNPARGFVASANNRPVAPDWPHPLPGFYDPYRIARADARLSKPGLLTRADMESMQLDIVSVLAQRWRRLAAEGAKRAGDERTSESLERWDARMARESRDAALFAFWWREMARAIFEDELGDEWESGRRLVEEVLTAGAEEFLDDRRTAAREGAVELSARAFVEAKRRVAGATYGEAVKLTVEHPLARVAILDHWLRLNRGPAAWQGDAASLNASFTRWAEDRGAFRARIGPSMRFVLDWKDPDSFTISTAFGQSGNPFSSHYDDFFEMSARGERWQVPFTRAAVETRVRSTLRLLPGRAE